MLSSGDVGVSSLEDLSGHSVDAHIGERLHFYGLTRHVKNCAQSQTRPTVLRFGIENERGDESRDIGSTEEHQYFDPRHLLEGDTSSEGGDSSHSDGNRFSAEESIPRFSAEESIPRSREDVRDTTVGGGDTGMADPIDNTTVDNGAAGDVNAEVAANADNNDAMQQLRTEVSEVLEDAFGPKQKTYIENAKRINKCMENWQFDPDKFGPLLEKLQKNAAKLTAKDREDESLKLATAMIFMSIEERTLVFQQIRLNYHTKCAGSAIWVYVKFYAEYLKMKEKEYGAGLKGKWSICDSDHQDIKNLF